MARATGLGVVLSLSGIAEASAHVKWFCAFDVAGQPRSLEHVLLFRFLAADRPRTCYPPGWARPGRNAVRPRPSRGTRPGYRRRARQRRAAHPRDLRLFLRLALDDGLAGLERTLFGARPLDVVRWAAGVTLTWASIEKWAYPEWTFPLFITHPEMTLGTMASSSCALRA
jgi:hypothetical protein